MSILELSLKLILEQVIQFKTNGSALMYKQAMCTEVICIMLNINQLIHRNGRIKRYNSVRPFKNGYLLKSSPKIDLCCTY